MLATNAFAARMESPPENINLPQAVYVFDPKGQALTIEDVSSPSFKDKFSMVHGDLAAGFGTPLWLRIDIDADRDHLGMWWLEIGPAFLNAITLYAPSGAHYQRSRAGSMIDAASRDFPFRRPVFFVDLGERPGARSLYLFLETQTTRSLHTQFWRPAAFARNEIGASILWGCFLGGLVIMALFNSIFGIYLKERLYLIYAVYVLGIALLQYVVQGFASSWLPAPWFNHVLGTLMALTIGVVAETLRIVRAGHHFPRLYLAYRKAAWVLTAIAALIALSGHFNLASPLIQVVLVVQVIFHCSVAILTIRKKEPSSPYYLSAFIIQFLAIPVFFAHNVGWLFGQAFVEMVIPLSGYMQTVLMNFAVARQIKTIREERNLAQVTLIQHLHDAQATLESQVAKRTETLRMEMTHRQNIENSLVIAHEQLQKSVQGERSAWQSQKHFFMTVSHDFRTPLSILEAGLYAKEQPDPKQLERMRRATAELQDMVDQCLVSERFDSPNAFLPRSTVHLDLLMETALERARQLSTGHLFELGPVGPEVSLPGDAMWLQMMLTNILVNAVLHTPPRTRVSVAISKTADVIEIFVRDSGKGLPDDELDSIFEKFQRGRQTKAKGTGLGLYLVRQIAEQHGGQARAANVSPHGLEICVCLPCG